MTYVFKRPFRTARLIEAPNPLSLRAHCRRLLGWRRSARLRYRQIGATSFRIETRRGWPVAEVWGK